MSAPHPPEWALAVETSVEERHGQWVVAIAVVFADGVVRHEVGTHRTRRRAEIAASWIKRAAERDPLGRSAPGDVAHPSGLMDVPDGP